MGQTDLYRIAQALGIDEAEIATRKAYLALTEQDLERLRALRARLRGRSAEFIDRFYRHLLSFAPAHELLQDPATLARVKQAQVSYFESLAAGEYDAARVDERLGIGVAHQRIGLEPKWYLGAYCHYLAELAHLAFELTPQDPAQALAGYQALLKVVFLDMGLALDTYIYADHVAALRAQEARARDESQYRALVEVTSDWLWEVDEHGVYRYVSPKVRDLLGYAPEDVLGKTPFDFMPPDEARRVGQLFAEIAAARRPFERLENVNRHRDGRYVTLETSGVPVYDEHGEFRGYRGIDRNVSARKQEEATRRILSSALEQSADLVMIVDRQGVIEYVNPAFTTVTGYAAQDVIGRTPSVLKSGMQDAAFYSELWRTALSGRSYHNVLVNRKKDGSLFYEDKTITPLRDPVTDFITHFISTGTDITESMRLNERLQYLASHDALTGLANRARFVERLGQAVVRAGRQRRAAAVLYVDIDRFKVINETLGHEAGDQMIRQVGERLRDRVRAMDCVARLGGDDFAVLLEDLAGADCVPPVVDDILKVLAAPFESAGRELFKTASIGISVYPDDGADAAALLGNAEAAMYQSKSAGRSSYRFYRSDMNARAQRRLDLEGHLHRALERQEFLLHYQPQVALASDTIIGVEALIRWRHPELGLVAAGEFVPMLEETGLVVPVGDWVLRAACAQTAAWRAAGLPPLRVSVNLSALQFHKRDFLSGLASVIAESGIDPATLELEVTESVMLHDVEGALDILRAINRLGVRLAVDDFGTGYSSLSYLKQVPLHTLKLAQPFVHGIPHDSTDCGITRAVVAVARSLGLAVVAEGVETAEQLAFLRREGCDAIQGYLCCRPVSGEDVRALLARHDHL